MVEWGAVEEQQVPRLIQSQWHWLCSPLHSSISNRSEEVWIHNIIIWISYVQYTNTHQCLLPNTVRVGFKNIGQFSSVNCLSSPTNVEYSYPADKLAIILSIS